MHCTLWRLSLNFVHILRTDWDFLTTIGILIQVSVEVLHLKFQTSAPMQTVSNHIAVNTYYLQVSRQNMNLKLSLGILLKLVNDFINLIT